MGSQPGNRSLASGEAALSQTMIVGLLQLLKSAAYAEEVGRPRWDFAVEIESLRAAGLTNGDLRWLACRGYVEHAVETRTAGSEARSFEREGRLTLHQATCFVLTERGIQSARRLAERPQAGRVPNRVPEDGNGTGHLGRPHWDQDRGVLRVSGKIVKQFRVPAENQKLILTTLEELGWQRHIDDPLPPVPGLDPKQRLRDTISRLNHNQLNRLIRFHGDGNGRGVWWELLG